MARILAWDRRRALHPVAIDSAQGAALLADLDEAARAASWHLVDGDGVRASGGAAVAPLVRLLPAGGPAAALAARFPRAADAGYRAVARRRGALGRLVTRGAARRARRRIAERA